MASDGPVAAAGEPLQGRVVGDAQAPPAALDRPRRPQRSHDAADIAAPHPEHRRELLLGDGDLVRSGAIARGEQPFRRALLDRVDRVAGDRLEDLGDEAIGVAREQPPQRGRAQLRLLEPRDRQPQEGPGHVDDRARESRQPPLADDAADGTLAPDEHRLDAAPVLEHDEKRGEAVPAGEIDVVDHVAGLVDRRAGLAAPILHERGEHREVVRAQCPQKVVLERAVRASRGTEPVEGHRRLPSTGAPRPQRTS